MLKLERTSVMNLENAMRGARNPMNSWGRMDSFYDENGEYKLGPNDLDLAKRLRKAGSDHRKFLRQVFVSVDVTAPLYWWKEYDTYKVATVANSTSTMHKIASKPFSMDDFSCDHMTAGTRAFMETVIAKLEEIRLRYLDDAPLCLETTYLPPSFEALIDRDINGSLYATLRQEFHRAPAQGHKTFEVCYASQNEAFLLNVERGQALILITDYVYDTDGRPLHVSKRIQRTDRAKYTEPIG